MKLNWTTEKGAKVELDITEEKVTTQKELGYEVIKNESKWVYTINSLKINGQEYQGEYNHSTITCKVGTKTGTVIIPEDIKKQITSGWDAELKTIADTDKEYTESRRKIYQAMDC